jgi:hypothetical protein
MSDDEKSCRTCGALLPSRALHCRTCGCDPDADPRTTTPRTAGSSSTASRRGTCSSCGAGDAAYGSIELRTGGHSGTAVFLFGGIAEASEGVITFSSYTCRACGHVDLYR